MTHEQFQGGYLLPKVTTVRCDEPPRDPRGPWRHRDVITLLTWPTALLNGKLIQAMSHVITQVMLVI